MPETSERRLDTLAEILECDSMCVAVACIDSKFVISANEFHTGTQNGRGHHGAIIKIMEYFQNLANGNSLDVTARDRLLKGIYERRFSHKDFSKNKAKENELEFVLRFINSEALNLGVFKGQKKDFNNNHEIRSKASIAYTEMLHIYNDIRKLEDSTIHASKYPDAQNLEISTEHFAAFKGFHQDQIIKTESRKNNQATSTKNEPIYSTHAEMQLLNYLIENNIEKPVYLGISKKCCVDCHCMLDAANAVLTEQDYALSIEHAQDHDGDFGDKWFFPDQFYNNKETNSLYFLIKTRYQEQIEDFRKYRTNPKYYQHKDDSESEPSQDPTAKQKNYKQLLEDKLFLFKDMVEFDQNLLVHKEFADLGLHLNTQGLFEDFFDLSQFSSEKEIGTVADDFINRITREEDKTVELKKLKKFLSSPYFPEVTHKDKLCEKLENGLQIIFEKDSATKNLEEAVPTILPAFVSTFKSQKGIHSSDNDSKRAREDYPEDAKDPKIHKSASTLSSP